MAGAVLNEREGAEAVRGARRVGWGRAVFGSACLWAWGFLAYLSPVLIPAERPVGGVGIEVGFFVSQGAVVVAAVAIVLALRKRSVAVGRGVLLVCASLLALASALLPLTVAIDAPWPLVGCGAICGVAGTLLGCAWGARYSLESRDVSAVVMVSFLVAYGIYFAILLLYVATPFVVAAQVVVVFLPLASWGLWFWDASARSGLAPEVFPSSALSTDIAGSPGSSGKAPGEVTAGSRELHALPWRSLGVIAVAALVGNVMASVIMGTSYEGADSLYPGGIALCACIATMALVPLTAERTAFSVAQLYRITVTFSVVGLVAILVLGAAAVPVGGALVQGCTLFFQPLVYVVVTRSTRLQGLSPLVAFGVGQALISAVVLAGNLAGKLLFQVAGETPLLLSAVCGAGVLALFFMVVARAAQVGEEGNEEKDGGTEEMEAETRGADRVKAAAAGRGSSGVAAGERLFEDGGTTEAATLPNGDCAAGVGAQGEDSAAVFARAVGLTARETEILSLLVRGRTLPYIANELFVTTGTVKTHVRHIYEKALVNNRQELLDKVEAR
ncbi:MULTISPECIES: response regulator transcription factor [Adlercreutzia]|uniref:response regulator transcription factor n=2 Tax=Eggerthellaceae TaxID=1643826 RepID=UPI0015F0AB08|nr:LuxR C-terminal-related transcriptional regulator [Adlercreutzia sp.]MCB6759558.1 LuxR C-terminal-related transcriptional regulator [Adlercreutzia equolifaciens]MCB6975288.1 LuxR C-terminal-related transcriptional regulator [Adlercreutzia equolifaciens]MDE8683705.1 LuxR C-terminal-related transcriptional regulator [Adlercreutzia rubneri]MEE0637317.1 LuxR C-terminal-related transcriptional regulator [Adlercreutzia sp.]